MRTDWPTAAARATERAFRDGRSRSVQRAYSLISRSYTLQSSTGVIARNSSALTGAASDDCTRAIEAVR